MSRGVSPQKSRSGSSDTHVWFQCSLNVLVATSVIAYDAVSKLQK
jgi:hypothetical protein